MVRELHTRLYRGRALQARLPQTLDERFRQKSIKYRFPDLDMHKLGAEVARAAREASLAEGEKKLKIKWKIFKNKLNLNPKF